MAEGSIPAPTDSHQQVGGQRWGCAGLSGAAGCSAGLRILEPPAVSARSPLASASAGHLHSPRTATGELGHVEKVAKVTANSASGFLNLCT